MTLRLRPASIRQSLTIWNVATMIVVLGVYAAAIFTFVSRGASAALDERLRGDALWAAEMWEQRPDGTLTWFEGDDREQEMPWLQVWSPQGRLLFRSAFAARQPVIEDARLAFQKDERILSVSSGSLRLRLLNRESRLGSTPVVLQVARSEYEMRRDLGDLLLMLLLGLPVAVAAAGLGGYLLARVALAPVDRMAARARSMTAHRLGDRLPVVNPEDELGRLALVFNDLLERLEASFRQMRQFTSNVSHELRTPLAAMRSVGEIGARRGRGEETYRSTIASMLEEVEHLTAIVEKLLLMSRAEGGQAAIGRDVIDLSVVVEDVTRTLAVLAEEKRQEIRIACSGQPTCVGDRMLVRQALANLIDNAIRHTPDGTRIDIRLAASSDSAMVDVSDDGPGVPIERRDRLFERRPTDAASVGRGGTGLGLAIAKWAVEANHGRLLLVDPPHSAGSTFRVTFPTPATT